MPQCSYGTRRPRRNAEPMLFGSSRACEPWWMSSPWSLSSSPPQVESELLDRRDLDQQLLGSRLVESHVRDAFRTLAGDGIHSSFTEVVVTDAVPRRQHHVAVVADLRGNSVRELLDGAVRLAAPERHEIVAIPTARP